MSKESHELDQVLQGQKSGFYFEYKAGNGLERSRTLVLEAFRKWRGVLMEPNQTVFHELSQLKR